MPKFRAAVMTDAGASLMAAAFAEGFQMEFVKMLIGSGEYEENEKTVEALKKRTDLKNKRQEVGFSSAASAKENVMQLKALVTNENLDEGYHMTEIAVIAKKAGEGEPEVLYSIAIADEADYLPSKENPVEIVQEFYTKVANSENISIKVGMSAVALAEDLDKIVNPSIEGADERENIEEGDNFFAILGKIKRFFSDLKKVAFSGKYQDLEDKPSIPTIANNNTTTESGFALDARQANPNVDGSLAKQISALNDGLKKCGIYEQITGWHSASVNTSTTLTVQDITKYRYLVITGRYGDVVRSTHFIVTSQVIYDMKKYQLWCGSKSIGTVQFNSATSITFTQEEMPYAPMYVYGIY